MEIILHLGVHRSATTTLQHFLRHNADPYRQAGLEAWTPTVTRTGPFAGLLQNPAKAGPSQDQRGQRPANLVRLELARLRARGTRQLLISEENIIGSCRGNLRDAALYPDLAARLSRVLVAIDGAVCRVALSIRSYDDYWASAMSLVVARGGPVPDDALLRRLTDQRRGWRDLIAEVAHLVPLAQIVVWPFEALAGDPARQVELMTGGLALARGLRPAARHHPSPNATELARIVAQRGGSADAQIVPSTSRWMPFDGGQRAGMRARYLEDLDWLASGAGSRIRFFGPDADTADQRRVTATEMLDRASDVTGFAAPARPWTPQNGGRGIGNERRMVRTREEGASGQVA